jgi:hypothetical protein
LGKDLKATGALARRNVARVFVEEDMANYQAARALMGKGRNAGEGAAGLSKSSAKKSAVKNGAKGMSYEPHSYFMAGGLGSRLGRSA